MIMHFAKEKWNEGHHNGLILKQQRSIDEACLL
jgi:hypothetical protein